MKHILEDRIINEIYVADDKEAIKFVTDKGDVIARMDADAYCCSYTWVENIELPAKGFPCKVIETKDLDMAIDEEEVEGEYIKYYGFEIVTDNGSIVIDYRNSSNGYYGGNIVFDNDRFYGGVFKQNVSTENWQLIT